MTGMNTHEHRGHEDTSATISAPITTLLEIVGSPCSFHQNLDGVGGSVPCVFVEAAMLCFNGFAVYVSVEV